MNITDVPSEVTCAFCRKNPRFVRGPISVTVKLTKAQLRMARDLLTRDSHNEKTEGD